MFASGKSYTLCSIARDFNHTKTCSSVITKRSHPPQMTGQILCHFIFIEQRLIVIILCSLCIPACVTYFLVKTVTMVTHGFCPLVDVRVRNCVFLIIMCCDVPWLEMDFFFFKCEPNPF